MNVILTCCHPRNILTLPLLRSIYNLFLYDSALHLVAKLLGSDVTVCIKQVIFTSAVAAASHGRYSGLLSFYTKQLPGRQTALKAAVASLSSQLRHNMSSAPTVSPHDCISLLAALRRCCANKKN
jgi:hypothetical protein